MVLVASKETLKETGDATATYLSQPSPATTIRPAIRKMGPAEFG